MSERDKYKVESVDEKQLQEALNNLHEGGHKIQWILPAYTGAPRDAEMARYLVVFEEKK